MEDYENAGPTTVCIWARRNYGSSQRPTASGKPEAKIIQKRGAGANRTQADHSRREGA